MLSGGLMWVVVIVGLFEWIGCAFLCSFVASEKGRDSAWFWTGLFFGVFALIAIAGLPEGRRGMLIEVSRESPEGRRDKLSEVSRESPERRRGKLIELSRE